MKWKNVFAWNGDKEFSDEYIENLANQKIKSSQVNLSIVTLQKTPRFFGKIRAQREILEQENGQLKNQIVEEKQKENRSFYQIEERQDAIAAFEARLNRISKVTMDQSKRAPKESTLELWWKLTKQIKYSNII